MNICKVTEGKAYIDPFDNIILVGLNIVSGTVNIMILISPHGVIFNSPALSKWVYYGELIEL